MVLARVCGCGRLAPSGRCPTCERQRDQQPQRQAHRTRAHRQLRARVFARDGHRCVTCGATTDLTLDYIVSILDGGTISDDNAQTLCRSCNSRAGRRRFLDRVPPAPAAAHLVFPPKAADSG